MNKFATVALLCVSACLVKAECEILDGSNFGEKVMDADKGILKGSTPWFIKFYAPWCGHCQRMSASWGEFADKHREAGDLNVGKVDCTGDKAKDICQDYDVRGYPTLLFFPSKGQDTKEGGSSYYKFKGARTPEAWEKYTLGGGYLEQEAESEIPKNVEGFEYY